MYENEKYMNIEWSNIEKILNNTATVEEVEQFNVWLSQDATKREYFEKIHNYYIDPELSTVENNLKRKSHHSADNIMQKGGRSRNMILRIISSGITVAALLILTFLLLNTSKNQNITAEPIVANAMRTVKIIKDGGEEIEIDHFNSKDATLDSIKHTLTYINKEQDAVEDSIEYYTISVPSKQNFTLTLCDGTTVLLNAGSQLRYPNRFREGESRKVYLAGEGYFEVKHSDKQRFIVNVEHVNVVVYGTKFNINSHLKNTETILIEGSVAIDVNGHETIMKPNERAVVSKLSERVVIDSVNVDKYIAWTTGYFTFEGDKLSHIVALLEQWYDCDIELENGEIANEIFSCHIDKKNSLEDILKAIMNTNKVKYRRVGDKYILW